MRKPAVVLGALTISLCAASQASAGSVSIVSERVQGSHGILEKKAQLRYVAGPGERNRLDVRAFLDFTIVRDPAGVSPGPGCVLPDSRNPTLARCRWVEGRSGSQDGRLEGIIGTFSLGDLDDRATLRAVPGSLGQPGGELDGGAGNDVLAGGVGSDTFRSSPGHDRLGSGRSGTFGGDLFDGGPRPDGGDVLRPGPGARISYSERRKPVRLDLGKAAGDGERGEGDRILATGGVDLLGGSGRDVLVGNRFNNRLVGNAGRDLLEGKRGQDILFVDGERNESTLELGRGRTRDRADGGAGTDYVLGNRGDNVLSGGAGSDTVVGGPGDDLLVGRDGFPDLLVCGEGRDRLRLDLLDFFANRPGRRCERPLRPGSVGAVPSMDASEFTDPAVFGSQENAFVNLRCPGDGPLHCRGAVRLLSRGRVLGTGRFDIRRDTSGGASVRIGREGRRLLQRREQLGVVAEVTSRTTSGANRVIRLRGTVFFNDPSPLDCSDIC